MSLTNHMNKLSSLFCLLSLVLLSIGCGPDYAYQQTYELDGDEWSYADSLTFEFEVPDTNTIYDLYLDIKHSATYSNQNLYVLIHTSFPAGQRLTEQVSLELSDKGRWEGDCRGDWCSVRIPIQSGAYFNQTGPHQFVLEQYMRRDPVGGIRSLGMFIQETGKTRN